MVLAVVVVEISNTSGHFEWASTMTIKDVPMNGLAKSMWMLCHGFVGHVHGWRGARGGKCLFY